MSKYQLKIRQLPGGGVISFFVDESDNIIPDGEVLDYISALEAEREAALVLAHNTNARKCKKCGAWHLREHSCYRCGNDD